MTVSRIRKAVATFVSTLVALPAFLAIVGGESPMSWEALIGAVVTALGAAYATYRVPNAPAE